MKAERIDEYHKGSHHFYGALVVVHYLDDAAKDPKWGTFNADIAMDYYKKAMELVKERYGENIQVLMGMPDLVVRVAEQSAQADGAECVCKNHTDNDGWRCNVCGLLSPHRQSTDVPTKGVYCRNCEDTIEYNEMKPFRRDDDAVDMLCPGCDVVLVEGE